MNVVKDEDAPIFLSVVLDAADNLDPMALAFFIQFKLMCEEGIDIPNWYECAKRAKVPHEEVTKAAHHIIEWLNPSKPKKLSYNDYLQSPEWQTIRKRKLKSAGYKCQVCGKSNTPLEVHHNNYTKWGEEKDTDLVVLCGDCHGIYHAEGKIKDEH